MSRTNTFRILAFLGFFLTPGAVQALPSIDGTISPGEWDAYYLGTSVTDWQGGMSVDVYGVVLNDYAYIAYRADPEQPGWQYAIDNGIDADFFYKSPLSAVWPEMGFTWLDMPVPTSEWGNAYWTDGSDWSLQGDLNYLGIMYSYMSLLYGPPYSNVAELAIPVWFLTYAGTDGQLELYGQYWQEAPATPLYLSLTPQNPLTAWVDGDYYEGGWNDGHTWGVDAFARIQDAIDAVPSTSTILVAAGTYREQLDIGKPLTLTGAGIDVTIIEAVDPIDRAPYAIAHWNGDMETVDPCIGVHDAVAVHIDNLTVDGRELGPDNFYGVHYFNTSGTVSQCRIANVLDAAHPEYEQVVSLLATHGEGGRFEVGFSGNQIPNFQKGGIVLMGPDGVGTIDNCDIDDAPSPDIAGNGIQISYGCVATLNTTWVTGVSYTGGDGGGTGLLLFESGDVTTQDTYIDQCDVGIRYAQWNWMYTPPEASEIYLSSSSISQVEWGVMAHMAAPGASAWFYLMGASFTDCANTCLTLWGSGPDPGGGAYDGWTSGNLMAYVNSCRFGGICGIDVNVEQAGGMIGGQAWTNDFAACTGYGYHSNYAGTLTAEFNYWGDFNGPVIQRDGGKGGGRRPLPSPYRTREVEVPRGDGGAGAPLPVARERAGVSISPGVDWSPWRGDPLGTPHPMRWCTNDSVQRALNYAIYGDEVFVWPGVYTERVRTLRPYPVHIRGAQYGVDPTAPGARTDPAAESTIDITGLTPSSPNLAVEITSSAAGSSFDGFRVIGGSVESDADGSCVLSRATGTAIRNNILEGYNGIIHKGGNDLAFEQNRIVANRNGLRLDTGAFGTVTVAGNAILPGATPDADAAGMSLAAVTGATIAGNTASGFTAGAGIGGVDNTQLTITGNDFSGNARGVDLAGSTTFVTVAENRLDDCAQYGIVARGADLTIRNNRVRTSGDVGILLDRDVIDTERVTVLGNDLSGNTSFALQAMPAVTGTVDASGNWWGDATPGGVLAEVSGTVDYTPWLASGSDAGDPGFQGDFSTLWVDDDSPQAGAAGPIEEGISLVTGSTVYIAAGTYPGTVILDDTTADGIVLCGGDPDDRPALVDGVRFANAAEPLDGVTLQDLILRGDGDSDGASESVLSCENGAAVNDLRLVGCQIDGEGVAVGDDGSGGRHGMVGNLLGGSLHVSGCEFVNLPGWSVFDLDANSDYSPWGGNGLPVTGLVFAGNTVHDCNGTVSLRGHTPTRTPLVEVYDNTFENIGGNFSQTGAQWAACEINHADEARVYGNSVVDVALGIYGEGQAFQLWDVGSLDMHDNSVLDNAQGIYIFGGEAGGDYGGPWSVPAGAVTGNSISGNAAYGLSVDPNASGGPLDARNNWWGDPSGPYHPTENPEGLGNSVSDNVLFEPFTGGGAANIVLLPTPTVLTTAGPLQSTTVTVRYLGGASGRLFSWRIRLYGWAGSIADAQASDVGEGDLDWGEFLAEDTGAGDEVTVTGSLVGEDPGTLGPCDLFTVTFHGISEGRCYPALEKVYFRDRSSNNLSNASPAPGDLIVDGTVPAVTTVTLTNLTLAGITDEFCKNGDVVHLEAVVTESGDPFFDLADITADLSGLGGGAAAPPESWNPGTGMAVWSDLTVANATEEEDAKTIAVTATDIADQTGTGSDTIILDNVKPATLASLSARPGHERVDFSWVLGSETYPGGVKIVYNAWTNYPRYGSGEGGPEEPDYPASPADADVAYDGVGPSATWSYAARDIYYFSAYAYDMARNHAETAATARATNYWLGDVAPPGTYDGEVHTADISALSDAFNVTPVTDHDCDVAQLGSPNDPRGIPAPDGLVDFEDLMIFALNFGVVTPLTVPPFAVPDGPRDGELAFSIELPEATNLGGEFEARVMLSDKDGVVQGARFVVSFDRNVLQYIGAQAGSLVQSLGSAFFRPVEVEGQPDISAVALGEGVTFGHSGELAKVRFRVVGEGTISLGLRGIVARNSRNEELFAGSSEVVETVGEVKLPTEVSLRGAQPNPFAGPTTLAYGLPEACVVKLAVYDVGGRLVRVLASGMQAAGEHPVLWDGRDEVGSRVATGLYLYRLEAKGKAITRKLIVTE